jgi:hypothetical protein
MFVVVDLPFEPQTNTTPSGIRSTARSRKPGTRSKSTRPGIAEPPPLSRESQRMALPTRTAKPTHIRFYSR